MKDGRGKQGQLPKDRGLKMFQPRLNLKLFELVATLSGTESLKLPGVTSETGDFTQNSPGGSGAVI